MTIATNLQSVLQHIAAYEQQYGRAPGSVTLVGASKSQSIEKIAAAYEAGLNRFGENYLQEALTKINALSDKTIEWHFIGSIQRNKTRKIAEHFAWVHSVDDIQIAQRLSEQRPAHLPPLNICIEVNISQETSKSGVAIDQLLSLVTACQHLPQIKLRGLMAVPAPHATLSEQRTAFQPIVTLSNSLRDHGITLDTLSIGMTDDMEAAIAEGATIVRIGSAIFGRRE